MTKHELTRNESHFEKGLSEYEGLSDWNLHRQSVVVRVITDQTVSDSVSQLNTV